METTFTPLASLGGGELIGVASVMLMLGLGRIMGATGILGGIIVPDSLSGLGWRAALLAGMVTAPVLILLVSGNAPVVQVPVSTTSLIAGGLIVGIGTSFGGGCTSGHGVCGNARLSARSIAATLTFMAATFVTVFLIRHVFGA